MRIQMLGAFAALALTATGAVAQTAGPQNPGPMIPGVCVYHNARLLQQSTVGQSIQTGMDALTNQVRGELQPYADAINAEAQALQAGAQSIPAAELESRRQALGQRLREMQQLDQTRQTELSYTQQQQLVAVAQAVDPIVVQVYQERGCGLLLDREAIFVSNPDMDITPLVIQRLNQTLPSVSFGRMTPPVQPQQ